VDEAIQHRLCLDGEVLVNFRGIAAEVHEGVLFDDFNGRSPGLDYYDIDARDALGRTALMRAAIRGHDYWVELLLEAGADPRVRDYEGRSILDRVRGRSGEIVRMLSDAW
jgi:ankyrin repeat protein